MARGSLFLGQAKGKVGTVVNYVAKGEQRSRIYTKEGGRPGERATLPAREQRVRFGAASSEWTLYKFICSNMFKTGKETKESDYNFFVRKNWKYFPFLTKEENAVKEAYFIPGTFATGRLGTCNIISCNDSNGNDIVIQSMDIATAGDGVVKSTDNISKYVEFLKTAYPNATKITFAVLYNGLNNEVLGTPNTPGSRIHTYTLDLFNPPMSTRSDMTVADFLETICSNEVWLEMVNEMKTKEVIVAKDSLMMCVSNTDTFEPPTPPVPEIPGLVKVTFIYNGGRREVVSGQEGETKSIPEPTDGYEWENLQQTLGTSVNMANKTFVMPATDKTITEWDPNDPGVYVQERDILEQDSNNCILMWFPTNDRANDVYTVNLLPYNMSNSKGGFIDYMMKRDEEALAHAAESYGYQADTMHANIYFSGDSIMQDIENSVKIMALHDGAAAAAMESSKEVLKAQRMAQIRARREQMATLQQAELQELETADSLIEAAVATAKSRTKKGSKATK